MVLSISSYNLYEDLTILLPKLPTRLAPMGFGCVSRYNADHVTPIEGHAD